MAGLREIGSAFVRLFIKKDEMSAGLKQAEAEVQASAQNMVNTQTWVSTKFDESAEVVARGGFGFPGAAKKAKGGIEELGKSIKDTYTPVQKLTSALTGIVSLSSKILGLFGLVTAGIWVSVNAIRAFGDMANKSQKEVDDLKERVKQFGEESLKSFDPNVREFLTQIKEADDLLKKSQDRQKSSRTDAGVRAEIKAQEEAAKARRMAEENLKRYISDNNKKAADEEQKLTQETAEDAAKKQSAIDDSVIAYYHKIRMEQNKEFWEKYHQNIKDAEEAEKEADEKRRERNIQLWKEYDNAQAEAHRARVEQMDELKRAHENYLRILENRASSQRNQSASGDIRTMISLLQTIANK